MNCLNCEKELIKHQKKFCSFSCQMKWYRENTAIYVRKKKSFVCIECGSVFHNKGKFCSQHCAAVFNNRKRKNVRLCLNCNNVNHPKNNKSKFCSKKCEAEFKYKERIKKWKNNEIDGNRGNDYDCQLSQTIRKYILTKYNFKCSKCGWCEVNPVTGKSPLEINHIDGNPYNNVESNLEVLCPNCHAITPNYKALNKGNGRHHRRRNK